MSLRRLLQLWLGLTMIVLGLAACSASATPTPIPLSQVNLEPILILPGDLPAGLSGAQVRDSLPEMFGNLPEASNQIYQQFQRQGEAAGGVAATLYESDSDRDVAYTLLLKGFGDTSSGSITKTERIAVSNVGERAEAVTLQGSMLGIVLDFADLAFVRCGAVVHIRFGGSADLTEIVSYARRLDERLTTLVCR